MNEKQILMLLVFIFLSVQFIGLYAAQQYIGYLDSGVAEPMFENPQEISNAVFVFVYILIVTLIILIVVKYKKKLLTAFEAFAVFFASALLFELLIPYTLFEYISIGMIIAAVLTYYKIRYPSYLSQNIALICALSGAGAVIGVSFGVFPIMIFMLMLSVYDMLSVFWTKHMVYLAKAITERPMAFTAALPCKTKNIKHTFQLGGGDLAIPLMFSASILRFYGLVPALVAIAGALIALTLLFSTVLRKPGKALPALPPISAGAMVGFAIGLLLI